MHDGRQAQPARELGGRVGRGVVDQEDLVDDVARDVRDRPLERAVGVVGRKDDEDALAVDHAPAPLRIADRWPVAKPPSSRAGRRRATIDARLYTRPEVQTCRDAPRLSIVLAALLLACLPLHALEYEIHMLNGNVFHTRYEPVIAPFDCDAPPVHDRARQPDHASARDSVKEVISATEASGFGKRLDAMTVLIGARCPTTTPRPRSRRRSKARRWRTRCRPPTAFSSKPRPKGPRVCRSSS